MSFTGEVKSFNDAKGYGFIVGNDTGGKDIFLPKRALPPGAGVKKGDQVAFDIQDEPTGPVASNISFLRPAGGLAGRAPVGQPMHAAGAIVAHSGPRDELYGMGYLGSVKSFNAQKGYGFITSAVMQELHGKDVFFSASLVPGGDVAAGDRVFFVIKMEQKGPVAASVEVVSRSDSGGMHPGAFASYGPASFPSYGPSYPSYGPVGGKGAHYLPPAPLPPAQLSRPTFLSSQPQMKGAASARAAQDSKTRHYGSVKTYNDEKGYGHIECEAAKQAFGKDVFLMRSALQDQPVEVGMLLSFRVTASQKGPQACDVQLLPPGSFTMGDRPSEIFHGTIKSFSLEKKWGFVSGDEITQVFGKDVFVNLREFVVGGDYVPAVGDEVEFAVEIEVNGGRPEAKQVRLWSGETGGARAAPY